MPFASANSAKILRIAEVTYGTTPATPALQITRLTGETLDFGIENIISEEIRSDRQTSDLIQVGASTSGGIDYELSYEAFEDLFESALYGAFVSDYAVSDILIDTTASGFTDSGATGVLFTSIPVGAWIKVGGYVTNSGENNGFYRVTAKPDTDTLTTEIAPPSVELASAPTTMNGAHLRNGVTRKSFTIQRQLTDLTATLYQNFTGMVVDSMSLNWESGSVLGGSFEFLGKGMASSETQISGATEVAAPTDDILNAVSALQEIRFNGVVSTNDFLSIGMDTTNNLREQKAIGDIFAKEVAAGRFEMSGGIEIYLEDGTEVDRYIAGTEFSLSFRVADAAGQTLIFDLPRCKYVSLPHSATGLDEDVTLSGEYQAILDATDLFTFQISKFAA